MQDFTNEVCNGWLNIYKPSGISSAKVAAIIKKIYKGNKVGHAGTLDVEAEGVLPIAIGEATKLMQHLIYAHKKYVFTIKFGAKTNTGDYVGKITERTQHIPTEEQCRNICKQFVGTIEQTPPAFSAIKVNGTRAYKIARKDHNLVLPSRKIYIYNIECIQYNDESNTATYATECSKGTYIRTLAEDIALSLQSLGFVLKLRRVQVGVFNEESALNISKFEQTYLQHKSLEAHLLKIETVLDDIPVLDVDREVAQKIKFGQKCYLHTDDVDNVWIRYEERLLAIGNIKDNCFNSARVFNLTSI